MPPFTLTLTDEQTGEVLTELTYELVPPMLQLVESDGGYGSGSYGEGGFGE